MGRVTCWFCNAVVPEGAEICPTCGVEAEAPTSTPDATVEKAARQEPRRSDADHGDASPVARGSRTTGADPFAASLKVTLSLSSPLGRRIVALRPGDRLEIGREVGPLRDLCGDNISARHAEIAVGRDAVTICDTGRDRRGSTNGTFVGGSRLPADTPTQLHDGDVVTCASDPPLEIVVRIGEA